MLNICVSFRYCVSHPLVFLLLNLIFFHYLFKGPLHMGTEMDSLDRRIPDLDSMWSCVSSTRQADYAHCTAWLDLFHCYAAQHAARIWISRPCGGEVVFESRSPIRSRYRSKVPCGEPQCHTICSTSNSLIPYDMIDLSNFAI